MIPSNPHESSAVVNKDAPKDELICPVCKRKARIDEYGTLVVCGHRYGGVANGRLHLFNSLDELMKFKD